ncbi:MAG TPA: glycosyltransferase [Steroidobacteraceae bacterium]|nr:glycosyltransferase [Steroidobacteraceae bacterium]
MRVLFISDVYFPRVNGVSTSIRTFRQDLAECGIETLLVAPGYETPGLADDAGIIRVPASGVPGDPEDRRMRWGPLHRALDGLKSEAIDVVHIQTPFVAHYAGSRFAKLNRVPCVATYHTFFEEYLHHYVPVLPRGIGRFLARAFTRSQCDDVQALIAPSDPMRDVLLQYAVPTPIHVLPTGLPADRFKPGNRERFRAAAAIPDGRPLMTYIGRVAHEKNIEFLITVFTEVRRTLPQAMLVIAGEGPARPSLEKLVAQSGLSRDVHFAGYLDRDTGLLDCYAAADVFVFASRTETQGLVLLEAMAQGAPIVSTAELGTRSILKGACGALVVNERVADFAAAVVRVLQEESLRRELSQRGRTYAQSWSSAVMARRLADLYRSVLPAAATARAAA